MQCLAYRIGAGTLIGLMGLSLVACVGPEQDEGSTPPAVIELGQAIEEPADEGAYDAGWEVNLDLSAFASDSAVLIRGLEDEDVGFLLAEHSDRAADVWRGWLTQAGQSDQRRGSFTFTTQGDRIAGRVQLDRHAYSLSGREGAYRLFRIDQDRMPPPGPPVVPEDESAENH